MVLQYLDWLSLWTQSPAEYQSLLCVSSTTVQCDLTDLGVHPLAQRGHTPNLSCKGNSTYVATLCQQESRWNDLLLSVLWTVFYQIRSSRNEKATPGDENRRGLYKYLCLYTSWYFYVETDWDLGQAGCLQEMDYVRGTCLVPCDPTLVLFPQGEEGTVVDEMVITWHLRRYPRAPPVLPSHSMYPGSLMKTETTARLHFPLTK